MQGWITAVIGIVGTLGGTGLGYRGALSISRRDRDATLKNQMRQTYAAYLGALYESVSELHDLPPNRRLNLLDRAVSKMQGERGRWLARRRAEYRLTGDRYRQVAARLANAAAQLQVLPLPDDVEAAVDAANTYVEKLGEQRTPELKAQWPDLHARLMVARTALNA